MAALDILFAIAVIGLLTVFRKQLQEAVEEIRNRFGGPPGPMGPLPSTDAHLLLKRRRKEAL